MTKQKKETEQGKDRSRTWLKGQQGGMDQGLDAGGIGLNAGSEDWSAEG